MSISVMSLVYATKLGNVTRKAVALKLADYADDTGGNIFPAVNTVAEHTEVSERTVQRSIKEFLEAGLLEVEHEGGRGPGDTTRYRFNLAKLSAAPKIAKRPSGGHLSSKGDRVTPLAKGDTVTAKGDTLSKKGDTVTPDPPLTINNQKKTRASARAASSELKPLLEDWTLPEGWRAWAMKVSPEHAGAIDQEARSFKYKFAGSGIVRDDWLPEWKKWFSRTVDLGPPAKPAAKPAKAAGYAVHDTSESFAEYRERMIREGKYRPPAGSGSKAATPDLSSVL